MKKGIVKKGMAGLTIVLIVCVAAVFLLSQRRVEESLPPAENEGTGWLLLDFTVYSDNAAAINNVEILDNGIESSLAPGRYAVVLRGENDSILFTKPFSVSFYIWSDPPVLLDNVELSLMLPYNTQMKKVEIWLEEMVLTTRAL